MAVLSTKHARQQTIVIGDFSGGLNTSASMSGIQPNQLAEVVNMELDSVTNRLKTVSGVKIINNYLRSTLKAAMWDTINKVFVLVNADKSVDIGHYQNHSLHGESITVNTGLGILTGNLYPICASWEDGLLIASGGKLQYYNGTNLVTIDSSPDNCKGVFVRAGRVIVCNDTEVRYSGVGDETNWTEDTDDYSASVWVEAGYKDGGKFIGMVSLSSDILIIKDNRRVYRLSGEFPDWYINEVSRNLECVGRMSFTSLANSVIVLGQSEVQVIEPTADYGDMKPQNVGTVVAKELRNLPSNAIVRYVAPLSQVWFIGNSGKVLIFDITHSAWFMRQFNSNVVDVLAVGIMVFIVKASSIGRLDDNIFSDDNKPLSWRFVAKRLESQHDYLLKRTRISVVPFSSSLYAGSIMVGAVNVPLPIPARLLKVYHNRAKIHKNRTKLMQAGRSKGIYVAGEMVWRNPELVYGNSRKIFTRRDIIKESRNVYRSPYLSVQGRGSDGGFMLNDIVLDIVEV